MGPLVPLATLWEEVAGDVMPLPDELAALYGPLRLPAGRDRPYLYANFVSTVDGVVALNEPGTGGDEISGESREDRFVMGLLRAVADAVIVGAGTLRAFSRHLWTPEAIYRPLAPAFARLRGGLGKPPAPLTAVVSASGDLDLELPVFGTPAAPAVIVTTAAGGRRLADPASRAGIPVRIAGDSEALRAAAIVEALALPAASRVLLECGPTLFGRFLKDDRVDELFLTLAPQIAGRAPEAKTRDGLISHEVFLPHTPRWGELGSVKRCGSLLFLRYRFSA